MCATITYFYVATLAESRESGATIFVAFDIIPIFAPCSPFMGLVEKKSGVFSLAPDIFLFLFELFPEKIWQFQRNTLYLQHPKI